MVKIVGVHVRNETLTVYDSGVATGRAGQRGERVKLVFQGECWSYTKHSVRYSKVRPLQLLCTKPIPRAIVRDYYALGLRTSRINEHTFPRPQQHFFVVVAVHANIVAGKASTVS